MQRLAKPTAKRRVVAFFDAGDRIIRQIRCREMISAGYIRFVEFGWPGFGAEPQGLALELHSLRSKRF